MLSSYIKFIQLLTKALVYLQILTVNRYYCYIYLYYIDTTVYFIRYKYCIYYILVGIQQVASYMCVCVCVYIYEILYRYQSISIFKHQYSNRASLVAQMVKNPPCNAGDLGSIPGLGRCPGGGHGNPLQYSCLENLMDEEPGRLQSMGSPRVTVTKHTHPL